MSFSMNAPSPLEKEITLFASLKGSTDIYPQRMARFSPDTTFFVSTDGRDMRIWKRDELQHPVLHRVVETTTHMIAISHDSQLIASIEKQRVFHNHVYLWSPDGEQIADLVHRGDECHLAFSPVTSHLIVADNSGLLQWWDTNTFTLLGESDLPPETTQSPFNNTVRELAFAPDGKHLAVQWTTKQGAVQVGELEISSDIGQTPHLRWIGSVASSMLKLKSRIAELAYSPDWQYLAVGSEIENCVWLFDAFSLDTVGSLKISPAADGVAALAFSPDGAYLAVAGCDGTLWIGEVASQRVIGMMHAHPSQIGSMATVLSSLDWSSDGKWILTTGSGIAQTAELHPGESTVHEKPDYTVKIWKAKLRSFG